MLKRFLIAILIVGISPVQAVLIQTPASQKPAKPTTVDVQNAEAAKIKSIANMDFAQTLRALNALYGEIWKNPQGLNPQEVMDALGTDAASLLSLMETLSTSVNAISPGAFALKAPKSTVSNTDGTVTIGK